jgi:hypothetical protein
MEICFFVVEILFSAIASVIFLFSPSNIIKFLSIIALLPLAIGIVLLILNRSSTKHKFFKNALISFGFGIALSTLIIVCTGFTPKIVKPENIPCSSDVCIASIYYNQTETAKVNIFMGTPETPLPVKTATPEPTKKTEVATSTKSLEPTPTKLIEQIYCLPQDSTILFRKYPSVLSYLYHKEVTTDAQVICYKFINYSHEIEGLNNSDTSASLDKIWVRMDAHQIPQNQVYFTASYVYVRADKLLTKERKPINPFDLPEYVQPEEAYRNFTR